MEAERKLSSTYQFWDALIRYEMAWFPMPAGLITGNEDFLQQMQTVYEVIDTLAQGFRTLKIEARNYAHSLCTAEASASPDQHSKPVQVAVEADQGSKVTEMFMEEDSRLFYRDALAGALQHWERLGDILDAGNP